MVETPCVARDAQSSGLRTIGPVIMEHPPWTVVDLFSGAGGASAGFHAHPGFTVVAAADAQIGKPSSGHGSLGCNDTYFRNIGIRPAELDLALVRPCDLAFALGLTAAPTVLVACPPCTGFSRVNAINHLVDDPRNNLVRRVAEFVAELEPALVFLENARELLMGRFADHYHALAEALDGLGYDVRGELHRLTRFGLPQARERALVLAARRPLRARGLSDLWSGLAVAPEATHVRRALGRLPPASPGRADRRDPAHCCPGFARPESLQRIAAIPHDGGSWRDLLASPGTRALLTPTMRRLAAAGDLGSFCDVYGRMWWDRPAPTIKRECCHVGNGRYAHPEQDRLCTVREMALLQGFPTTFEFVGPLGNCYRHVGDAVPPLISWQIAVLSQWILTGRRPRSSDLPMPDTTLRPSDLIASTALERPAPTIPGQRDGRTGCSVPDASTSRRRG